MSVSDFILVDHGSIVVLNPINDNAKDWIEDNIGEHQTWCKGVVIERRYVDDIINGIQNDGFSVKHYEGK